MRPDQGAQIDVGDPNSGLPFALESIAAEHLRNWLPRLRYPTRSGEHSQTAFAFTLAKFCASGN